MDKRVLIIALILVLITAYPSNGVKTLYDSRDTSPPSNTGSWNKTAGEKVRVNGSGWGSNQSIIIRINDSDGDEIHNQQYFAELDGNFTDRNTVTLSSTIDPIGIYNISVSEDSGSNWVHYDNFTVVDSPIPEFPIGGSLVFLIVAILYGLMRNKFSV